MKLLGHTLLDHLLFFAWFFAAIFFVLISEQITNNFLAFLVLMTGALLISRTEKP